MKGGAEQGVTDIWKQRARKWEKATKDKENTLLPSVCVCVWVFFFSLCEPVKGGGRTWTLLSAPAGVHRTIHTHTHTRSLHCSYCSLNECKAESKEAGVREREREREREGRRRRNRWSCYLLLLVFQCEDWGLRMILLLLPLQQRDLVWGEHYNPTFFF